MSTTENHISEHIPHSEGNTPMIDFSGLNSLDITCDGMFRAGTDGVGSVKTTLDRKVEFVFFDNGKALALVKSAMGYPAYYPVRDIMTKKPLKAVLMDLDGTTVNSEHFWIWIIEKTTSTLLGDPGFRLDASDEPYVSGHSVSEHLQYCIGKYCPDKNVEEARQWYFKHVNHEINEILEGRGKQGAFTPSPGIKEFLESIRGMGLKTGLVTSGLYEKAWPAILSAFQTMGMGDPKDYYDAIITAGYPMRQGQPGTLGELSPKPHPWLYAETARVGLGIPFEERHHVVGIEDSGAGVVAILLSGFAPIGKAGGNIRESGTESLCAHFKDSFESILEVLS